MNTSFVAMCKFIKTLHVCLINNLDPFIILHITDMIYYIARTLIQRRDYKPTLNQRSFDIVIKKSPNEHLTATSQLFRLSAIFTKG